APVLQNTGGLGHDLVVERQVGENAEACHQTHRSGLQRQRSRLQIDGVRLDTPLGGGRETIEIAIDPDEAVDSQAGAYAERQRTHSAAHVDESTDRLRASNE